MTERAYPAGWKLGWIEQITIDRATTGLALRVAVAISRRLKDDGAAIVTQATLANIAGASERGVRKAVIALKAQGYLQVDAAGSGPGTATAYRPIIKWRDAGPGVGPEHRNARSGIIEARKAEQQGAKGGTGVPPHKNPSKIPFKIPGARVGVRDDPSDRDPLQSSWRAIKEKLAQPDQWGAEKVESWLDKLTIRDVIAGTLTLLAPTRFIANYLAAHHAAALLNEWRAIDPGITLIEIVPRRVSAPIAPSDAASRDEPKARSEASSSTTAVGETELGRLIRLRRE